MKTKVTNENCVKLFNNFISFRCCFLLFNFFCSAQLAACSDFSKINLHYLWCVHALTTKLSVFGHNFVAFFFFLCRHRDCSFVCRPALIFEISFLFRSFDHFVVYSTFVFIMIQSTRNGLSQTKQTEVKRSEKKKKLCDRQRTVNFEFISLLFFVVVSFNYYLIAEFENDNNSSSNR